MNIRLNNNLLELRFPYDPELVNAVKEIPGRRWNPEDKFWTVPVSSSYELALLIKRLHEGKSEVTFENGAKEKVLDIAKRVFDSLETSRAVTSEEKFPVPNGRDFRPYQKAGIKFALGRKNTLIGDEMRLGKSAQAIGVVNADTTIKRIVVVCPAGVKLVWQREINFWSTRNPEIVVANGNTGPWKNLFDKKSETQWLVVNYDIIAKWKEYLTDIDLLVLDEFHYLKNPKAQRTQNVYGYPGRKENNYAEKIEAISAKRIIALSGTPIPNRPIEAWPTLHALDPETFGNWKYYVTRYCAGYQEMVRGKLVWMVNGASNLEELQQKLRRSIMIRRKKEDVDKELPPKIRQIIELPVDENTRPLVKKGMDLYNKRIKPLEKALQNATSKEAYEQAAAELEKAQKILFEEISELRHETAIAKIPAILEYLHEIIEGGANKLLVFGWHHDVIDAIHKEFPNSVAVTGRDSIKNRQASIDAFQSDPNVNMFIGNILAAGVGIKLSASSHVVFAEEDWVPGNISQAEDRPYEVGVPKNILVQHLVLEGSMDVNMVQTTIEKQKVIDAALDTVVVKEEPTPIVIKPIEIKPVEYVAKQLPEGRRYYAVDNDEGETTFLRITAIYADGRPRITFVDQIIGGRDAESRGRVLENGQYIGQFKSLYDKVVADPEAAMIRFGKEIGRCGYCHKTLTDAVSRERGIGPVCFSKAFGR